jgi:hypothetical protein
MTSSGFTPADPSRPMTPRAASRPSPAWVSHLNAFCTKGCWRVACFRRLPFCPSDAPHIANDSRSLYGRLTERD